MGNYSAWSTLSFRFWCVFSLMVKRASRFYKPEREYIIWLINHCETVSEEFHLETVLYLVIFSQVIPDWSSPRQRASMITASILPKRKWKKQHVVWLFGGCSEMFWNSIRLNLQLEGGVVFSEVSSSRPQWSPRLLQRECPSRSKAVLFQVIAESRYRLLWGVFGSLHHGLFSNQQCWPAQVVSLTGEIDESISSKRIFFVVRYRVTRHFATGWMLLGCWTRWARLGASWWKWRLPEEMKIIAPSAKCEDDFLCSTCSSCLSIIEFITYCLVCQAPGL